MKEVANLSRMKGKQKSLIFLKLKQQFVVLWKFYQKPEFKPVFLLSKSNFGTPGVSPSIEGNSVDLRYSDFQTLLKQA